MAKQSSAAAPGVAPTKTIRAHGIRRVEGGLWIHVAYDVSGANVTETLGNANVRAVALDEMSRAALTDWDDR
jgi:hypothetical protein